MNSFFHVLREYLITVFIHDGSNDTLQEPDTLTNRVCGKLLTSYFAFLHNHFVDEFAYYGIVDIVVTPKNLSIRLNVCA